MLMNAASREGPGVLQHLVAVQLRHQHVHRHAVEQLVAKRAP
jgi:hypothetical protein